MAALFAGAGAHLERYARRFDAVEINSSFHRPHRPATYARWADSVPPDFRFAAKLPREITHTLKLAGTMPALERFLGEVGHLGSRLGPLLVQLPPSFDYDPAVGETFFRDLRRRFDGDVVCKPRNAGWFTAEADAMLVAVRVARVAADPAPVPEAATPGGWRGLDYRRLHGSPKIYASAYSDEVIAGVAAAMSHGGACWCIFDNTARGEATGDALKLLARCDGPGRT